MLAKATMQLQEELAVDSHKQEIRGNLREPQTSDEKQTEILSDLIVGILASSL